jgi:beta-lactamase superfamily II metal-dependent hydrolase
MILVLFYISSHFGTVPVASEKPGNPASKTVSVQENENQPAIVAEEHIVEVETEPAIVIDENALPLEIHQIDVSCANAYLIRYDGFTLFVDGGQSFSYDNVLEHLDNFGVKSIDCYIATHWHKDHVANMVNILNTFGHERTVVYGPSEGTSGKYWVPKGTYMQMTPGTNFEIGDVGFLCVGPDEVTQNGSVNNDSLNILVQYKDFKFLMTGDYMKDAVIKNYGELLKDIDVLQMPHHGLSPFCISEGALRHCNPSTILVPADASKPTHELVGNLGMDAKILDNTNGSVAVVSYGNGYQVYTDVKTPNDLQ